MLDYQELVEGQLAFLITKDPASFDRAVQALRDLKIYGVDSSSCFLAVYANDDTCTNEIARKSAYDDIEDACYAFKPHDKSVTALEWIIIACKPGEPLDKEQREFLALCEMAQKWYSLQATGSEG